MVRKEVVSNVSFIERFSSLSPFLILDENLYPVLSRPPRRREDKLVYAGTSYAVADPLSLAWLEKYDSAISQHSIEQYKSGFVKSAIDQCFKTPGEIADKEKAIATVQCIMCSVLPLMIDSPFNMQDPLRVTIPEAKTATDIMQEVYTQNTKGAQTDKDIQKRAIAYREQALRLIPSFPLFEGINPLPEGKYSSMLGAYINGKPLISIAGEVFALVDGQGEGEGKDALVVDLGGKTWRQGKMFSVGSLETGYRQYLLSRHATDAVKEFEHQFLKAAEATPERKTLETFVSQDQFSYESVGWVRRGGKYYAYWTIPKFAMENPIRPEAYHPFPATRVGVNVRAEGDRVYSSDTAVVIDPMVHQALRDWTQPMEGICNISEKDYPLTAMGVLIKLYTAINSFINGLSHTSLERHGEASENARYFDKPLKVTFERVGEMSRKEAVRQGYMITNEWHIQERLREQEEKKEQKMKEKGKEKTVA